MTVSLELTIAAVAGALATCGGLSWWFWRPQTKLITSTTPESSPERPEPDIVNDRRTKQSEETASKPPMPTPPGRFAVSDEYADSMCPSKDQNSTSPEFGGLEYDWGTDTQVSMDDVGGLNDLKNELRTDVIKPLTTGRKKAEALDIPLPNIVFHGPPGTVALSLA